MGIKEVESLEQAKFEAMQAAKLKADILSDLNSVFKPHEGQLEIGKALFGYEKKLIVGECGRKFGKTEFLVYALYRMALMNDKTFSYYIAPWRVQIADLVWANGRLPAFFPDNLIRKYIHSINNTDMRIIFKNGSFIKCDGSDNYEKGRGYSCTGMACYDELKDHNPNFHNAFEPNLGITDAPLLAMGTPAYEAGNVLTRLADLAAVSKKGAFFSLPCYSNPYISREFFERKKEEHIANGDYDLYQLEYEAKRVKVGRKHIFPMLKTSMVIDHDQLIDHVTKNRKDYDFYMGYDPGSVKCFAVMIVAIHRFNKNIIILDEIYATELGKNSTRQIVPVALFKSSEINPNDDDWMDCYDYAAQWFYSEVQYEYPDYPHALVQCEKDNGKKEKKISLVKDILLADLLMFSSRAIKSYWEMDNYKLDDNGKLLKENDHLIDCFRYILNLANYSTIEESVPLKFNEIYKVGTPEKDRRREKEDYEHDEYSDYIIGY